MIRISSTKSRTRRHLFLGSAAGALACALAALPAYAQTTHVDAAAGRSLVNDQANQSLRILSDTGNSQLSTVAGPVDTSSIALSDNDVTATARGNRATQDLEPDPLDTGSVFGPTTLSAGSAGVTGNAERLIANRQNNKATEISANNVGSAGTTSALAVNAGQVSASKLAVSDNRQEAVALGNDAASTLATSGGSGAGIVSFQAGDSATHVAAQSFGATGLSATDIHASNLAVTGNLERGIAYGNAVDNALTAKATRVMLVDPYLEAIDLEEFGTATEEQGVRIEAVTESRATYMTAAPDDQPGERRGDLFVGQIERMREPSSGFGTINVRVLPPALLHDRFLVVDDAVWHLGHSFNGVGYGRLSCIAPLEPAADALQVLEPLFQSAEPFEKWWSGVPVPQPAGLFDRLIARARQTSAWIGNIASLPARRERR